MGGNPRRRGGGGGSAWGIGGGGGEGGGHTDRGHTVTTRMTHALRWAAMTAFLMFDLL